MCPLHSYNVTRAADRKQHLLRVASFEGLHSTFLNGIKQYLYKYLNNLSYIYHKTFRTCHFYFSFLQYILLYVGLYFAYYLFYLKGA